jgi:hypothetical protein
MTKTVDSEPPKTVSELTHIQRWEEDGGAVSEGGHPISNVAVTSTPQLMGVEKNDLLYGELNNTHAKGDKQVNPIVFFLASNTGRLVRIIGGLALVALGQFGFNDATALIVMLAGAVPLLAGTFDVCLFAPLFGAPISGPKIRANKKT